MKKGDIRKQDILNTAEQLFCKNGYEQTSIHDILNNLQISKGSLYHHFIGKEALLEEICRRRAEKLYKTASAFAAQTKTATDHLNELMCGMIPFSDEKLSFLMMLLPVFRLPEGRTVRMAYCDAISDAFLPAVSLQLQSGHTSKELICTDCDITADMIISLVNRFWVQICTMVISAVEKNTPEDYSEYLRLTESYRHHIEQLICLPYGTVRLIDIPTLGNIIEQIRNHWLH